MKNLLKKSLLMGIGALSLTKEKAERFIKELEDKGEVTSEEAKEFVNELVDRGEQERSALKNVVASELDRLKSITGIITKKDLASFEERIRQLEERSGITRTESEENSRPTEVPPTV